jgi:hypothetical protein
MMPPYFEGAFLSGHRKSTIGLSAHSELAINFPLGTPRHSHLMSPPCAMPSHATSKSVAKGTRGWSLIRSAYGEIAAAFCFQGDLVAIAELAFLTCVSSLAQPVSTANTTNAKRVFRFPPIIKSVDVQLWLNPTVQLSISGYQGGQVADCQEGQEPTRCRRSPPRSAQSGITSTLSPCLANS